MEKNDFLLYNEVLYRLHACRTMEEFRVTLLAQIQLLIPYTYGTFIPIQEEPETGELVHGQPYCKPREFEKVEQAWLAQIDRAYTMWLSHAMESVVIRDSEILEGDSRFTMSSYQIYQAYQIHDCVQMNVVYGGHIMGRLALYRTKEDGVFTEQEAFYLRVLANHVNLVCDRCLENQKAHKGERRSLEQLTRACALTRREEEILGMIFRDMNNEEIVAQLSISRNTLLKHLQNLYRKCGVSSRWDLLKLRG